MLTGAQCPADHGQALSGTAVRRGTCPLPVDDYTASRTGEWGPWTEEPQCVYPEVEDWDEDVKFCIYTFGTYNLGEGISLLTTPEAAANVAGTLWNPEPAWRARKHHRRNTNSEASEEIKYRLEEIQGKGIGAVATQKILRKEVFITDLPSLLIDARLETLSERPIEEFEDERKEIYEKAVENLPGKDRVLRLASSKGGNTVDDIFKTNSFLVAMDEGGNHNGLFPEIARINHDCDPNASARFSNEKFTMEAMALRDIEPGEEISFNYIPWGLASDHRDYMTTHFFGFKCRCSLCTAPPEDIKLSDTRRRRIQELEVSLHSGNEPYESAVDKTQELLNLANEEGLHGKMQEFYLDLMGVFYDYGDYENALLFAEMALQLAKDFEEPGGSVISGIRTNIGVLRGLVETS